MRSALLLVLLAACGPKASTTPSTFDEDLGKQQPTAEAAPVEAPRPEAPVGKGLRTGTIERARLLAVLDAGPGTFLRQLEVTAHMKGERFQGWELVQLVDRTGPLVDVDLQPGDILLAVNGKPISRPDEFQAVWESLRTANSVDAKLWRGNAQFQLSFTITDGASGPATPAVPPASKTL
jgi:type II secretory pathway component PulC